MRCLIAFFFLIFCPSLLSAAEISGPAPTLQIGEARLTADDAHIAPGKTSWIALDLSLPSGWHTYWLNPGDTGFPAKITTDAGNGILIGPLHWPMPKRFEESGLVSYGYIGNVVLPIPVTLPKNYAERKVPIRVHAEWLVCKDFCLPEKADLTIDLTADAQAAYVPGRVATSLANVPAPSAFAAHYAFDAAHVWATLPPGLHATRFLPLTTGSVSLASAATVTQGAMGDVVIFPHGPSADASGFAFVAAPENGPGIVIEARHDAALSFPAPSDASEAPVHLPLALLLAFLGGLLLNVMPCVLPVLSLKILGLLRSPMTRRESAAQGLAYTAGILASFAVLAGALIALRQGGQALGWGYQLQSPLFVLGLMAVLFVVGLMLSGVVTLPVLFGEAHHRASGSASRWGSFLAGGLATLVATPCTAPFMAPAIGVALTLPALPALLIFEALGLGLAFPFLAISLIPALHRLLPKPGRWMETCKQFLAFPLYAAAAWMLWLLSVEGGPKALGLGLGLLLWIAFIAWMLPRLCTRTARMLWLIVALGGAVVVASPLGHRDAPFPTAQAFSESRIEALRKEGKAVFVDATADWCLTCKLNERFALADARVMHHFAERGIVTLRADWTQRDPALTQYLARFGRSGVPAYVYYPVQGEPRLLPPLLSPDLVIRATR